MGSHHTVGKVHIWDSWHWALPAADKGHTGKQLNALELLVKALRAGWVQAATIFGVNGALQPICYKISGSNQSFASPPLFAPN